MVFNNLVFQWGKLTNVTNSFKEYNLNLSCTILAITATCRDKQGNEHGIYTNNFTSTSFSICCRGYNGGSYNINISYILIGSI